MLTTNRCSPTVEESRPSSLQEILENKQRQIQATRGHRAWNINTPQYVHNHISRWRYAPPSDLGAGKEQETVNGIAKYKV